MSTSPVVWLGAITTIVMISFVFRMDNKVYRLFQNAFLGIAAGNAVVVGWQNFDKQALKPLFEGKIIYLIPIVIGLMLYSRYMPNMGWLARYPMALLIASGAGIGLAGAIQAQFLSQVSATFVKLDKLDNIILFLGVLSVICYFFFTETYTKPLKGPGEIVTKVGRWVMMVGFGASFGNAVMGRCSLLIARLQFLLTSWLGLS